ncbi:MAG: hypothetical protein GQ552_01450 [Flavobacteriaceae bacterium]|nr:hypothetical protein [Flavobacteriaceae bacterium]
MNRINSNFKIKIFFSFLFFIVSHFILAQDVTTIQANNEDISDNLDLEAVASIFGESKDVEDFEKRLNDPDTQISNLDLNNDGEVDYLRVMETGTENNVHTISIQAVIGKDQFQEVATIDVEKDSKGESQVQVIGNVDMYGPNYYITPVYPVVPVFFTFFWMATYHPWYSPWHWGYHPPYFRPWRPYSPYRYRSNVHVHVNVHNSYHRTNVRMNNNTININSNNKSNSYFKNNPDKSFNKRNPGVSNRSDLNKNRKSSASKKGINNKSDINKTAKNKGINTDRGYKSSGKPVTKPSSNKSKTKPSAKPSTKPATRPSTKPSTRPSTKPSTRPTNKSSYSKPSSRPSNNYSRQAPSRSSHRRTRH